MKRKKRKDGVNRIREQNRHQVDAAKHCLVLVELDAVIATLEEVASAMKEKVT